MVRAGGTVPGTLAPPQGVVGSQMPHKRCVGCNSQRPRGVHRGPRQARGGHGSRALKPGGTSTWVGGRGGNHSQDVALAKRNHDTYSKRMQAMWLDRTA